ncbi:hypothetical protein Baya_16552 [Bagarius yarrelli]|uniref:Uncharacterized protein n=1 Tax=Bagarius yarrelli TaxID=175774 RepID=A0A556VVT0_BAGYA|nr:hypothetical protein Baya_16552 [Bagarius yarrelli]
MVMNKPRLGFFDSVMAEIQMDKYEHGCITGWTGPSGAVGEYCSGVELKVNASADVKKRFEWEFVAVRILRNLFGIPAEKIFCLQDFSKAGRTWKAGRDPVCAEGLRWFFDQCSRQPEEELLRGLRLVPLYAMREIPIVVHIYNPFVADERKSGDLKGSGTGRGSSWRSSGWTPRRSDHGTADCGALKACSLCGSDVHLYRQCSLRKGFYAGLFSESIGEKQEQSCLKTLESSPQQRQQREVEDNGSQEGGVGDDKGWTQVSRKTKNSGKGKREERT